jgi:hypothetical protein
MNRSRRTFLAGAGAAVTGSLWLKAGDQLTSTLEGLGQLHFRLA